MQWRAQTKWGYEGTIADRWGGGVVSSSAEIADRGQVDQTLTPPVPPVAWTVDTKTCIKLVDSNKMYICYVLHGKTLPLLHLHLLILQYVSLLKLCIYHYLSSVIPGNHEFLLEVGDVICFSVSSSP